MPVLLSQALGLVYAQFDAGKQRVPVSPVQGGHGWDPLRPTLPVPVQLKTRENSLY